MNTKSLTIKTVVTTLAFVASAGLALAQPAVVKYDTKVRNYAGNGAPIVDFIYGGEDVNVKKCKSGWCRISYDGTSGWVKQKTLAFYDYEDDYAPYPAYPVYPASPSVSFGVHGGSGGVSFGFGLSSY